MQQYNDCICYTSSDYVRGFALSLLPYFVVTVFALMFQFRDCLRTNVPISWLRASVPVSWLTARQCSTFVTVYALIFQFRAWLSSHQCSSFVAVCTLMFQFRDCPSLSCDLFHEFLSSHILRQASIQWTRLVNTRTKRSGYQVFGIQELSDYACLLFRTQSATLRGIASHF